MCDICAALAALHTARGHNGEPLGIVHRDVSPKNVLVGADGYARLIDLGIAKAHRRAQQSVDGEVKGTLAYLAPEQIDGRAVDARTDVFAVGVLAWELLTGERAFAGAPLSTRALSAERLAAPSSTRPGVPAELDALVRRAIAPEPADRYQDAASMRRALLEAGTGDLGTLEAMPVAEPGGDDRTPTNETSNFSTERRWLVPALVIALVGSALMIAYALLSGGGDQADLIGPADDAPPAVAKIIGAQDVDPNGDDAEHADELPNSFDQNDDTFWSTESYGSANLGNKPGVGIGWVVKPAQIERLNLTTTSTGWSADVYVLERQQDLVDFDPEANVVATSIGPVTTGTVELNLQARQGEVVLLWITDLGDAESGQDLPYSVRINEAEILVTQG